MAKLHAKRLKTRVTFARKKHVTAPPKDKIAGLTPARDHDHEVPSIPNALLPVVRKTLRTHHLASAKRRKVKQRKREANLLESLKKRIDSRAYDIIVNRRVLHPIAVLAWLSSEEPFNADFLLEHAHIFEVDEPADMDPVFAAELDSLIDRFNTSQRLEGVFVKENALVAIPKDYGMITTPEAIGEADPDVLMQEGDDGLDEDERLFKHFGKITKTVASGPGVGFDPVDVLKNAAIQFGSPDTPRFSTLSNDIHPLFREENFHGCPPHIYDVFRPALRLITRLLTSKLTSHFWHTLLFGERVSFSDGGSKPSVRIPNAVPYSTANALRFERILDKLVSYLHFNFSLWPTHKDKMWVYGSMHPIRDYKTGLGASGPDGWSHSRICLHSDFYITAKKLSLLQNPDPAMVLRFNFFIAVNLCHELSHFFELSGPHVTRYEKDFAPFAPLARISDSSGEAYMFDQPWNEPGYAFETRVFGGLVKPISLRTDCLHGLTHYDEPAGHTTLSTTGEVCTVRTFYTVPMEFIAMMQQDETWHEESMAMHSSPDWKVFHIPRDGAKAVKVPYFDMTVWKDEMDGNVVSDGFTTPFRRTKVGVVKN